MGLFFGEDFGLKSLARLAVCRVSRVVAAAGVDDVDDDLFDALIAEGDAKGDGHQDREAVDPEDRLGLAQELADAGRDELAERPVAMLVVVEGVFDFGSRISDRRRDRAISGGLLRSSLRWRPASFTKTSSRLAWRVVRLVRLQPCGGEAVEQRRQDDVRLADREADSVAFVRAALTEGRSPKVDSRRRCSGWSCSQR